MQWVLFDASDPLSLVQGGSGTITDHLRAIGLFGNALYVSYEPAGGPEVQIYNVSDIASPSYVNSFFPTDQIREFCFAGGHMYAATLPVVLVYSLADPLSPVLVDSYSKTEVRDLEAQGSFLHLVTTNEVEIVDISTPSAPVYMGSTTLPVADWFERITVEGQFGYVGFMINTPYSCWIWPPNSPAPLGPVHENELFEGGSLFANQGFLYQGTGSWGIRIFDLY